MVEKFSKDLMSSVNWQRVHERARTPTHTHTCVLAFKPNYIKCLLIRLRAVRHCMPEFYNVGLVLFNVIS